MFEGAKKSNLAILLKTALGPQKRLLLLSLGAVFAFNLLELLFPKLLQLYIDAVAGDPMTFIGISIEGMRSLPSGIFIIPITLLVFALIRWAFSYGRTVLQTRLGQTALFDLRNRIYDTMQSLSFAYHDSSHTGTLISNVVEDVGHASRFLEFGLFPLVEAPIYMISAIGVMFWVCWQAAAVSLALILFGTGISVIWFWGKAGVFARTKELFTDTVQVFSENMEGHQVVRAYGQDEQQKTVYSSLVKKLHEAIYGELLIASVMSQATVWSLTLGIPAVLASAIFCARNGWWDLTSGRLFLLFFLQSSMIPRGRMLTRSFDMVMRIRITADRLAPLFTSREYLEDRGNRRLPKTGPGSLEMDNVSFSYGTRQRSLKNVSLKVSAGQTIGLIGATGAGKSTLALLMCRFYDPNSGHILLDGEDIRNYPIEEVRDQFSLVFQESFLFSASVRDNIAYGRPGATLDEVIAAAKIAEVDSFVSELPDGYDTEVGERGVTLSGGQRQRISIARAILRKPRFLVLDDSTSALDTSTEKAIREGLKTLGETTTMILIAHRFSSLAHADRVFVLENGRIIETGSPTELNVPGTAFSRILQTQHGEQ